jgi:hypothetical protein
MNPGSTYFEARTVLDRIEASGNSLLVLNNRARYLKILVGAFLARGLVGLPLLFVVPLMSWLIDSVGLLTGAVLGIIV